MTNCYKCDATATRMENTNHPVCTMHYEQFMEELHQRILTRYKQTHQPVRLRDITPEVNWNDDPYGDLEVIPKTRTKQEVDNI